MATVVLRPSQSVLVSYGAGGNNYNDTDKLRVGVQSTTSTRYMTLVQFSLATIPAMAMVNSAALELYSYSDESYSSNVSIIVQRCTEAWAQGAVTYNSRPSVTGDGQTTAAHSGYNTWYDYNVKDIVQAWLNGADNYGVWMVQDGTTASRGKAFKRTGDTRPKLTIDYTPVGCGVKVGGEWKQGLVYAKTGGEWKMAQVYAKTGGVWKISS